MANSMLYLELRKISIDTIEEAIGLQTAFMSNWKATE